MKNLMRWITALLLAGSLLGAAAVSASADPAAAPPAPGTVLYQANWSSGMNGWAGQQSWKTVNGMLVTDGTNGFNQWIKAPYHPSTANYAIEAEMQVAATHDPQFDSFGIVARGGDKTGYKLGIDGDTGSIGGPLVDARITALGDNSGQTIGQKARFDPGKDWHTFRAEVTGNQLRLLIDGAVIAECTDNRYLESGQVGLWSDGPRVNVRSFKVIAL